MKFPVSVLFYAAAAAALASCSGNSNSSSTTTTSTAPASPTATMAAMKTATKTAANPAASSAAGQKIYATNCASCHQANGKGSPGAFPPLAGNSVVTGPAGTVIHIVKNGLTGKVVVAGATYNGQMPAWKTSLNSGQIADVITYIRSSWGNHASAVTSAQAAAQK